MPAIEEQKELATLPIVEYLKPTGEYEVGKAKLKQSNAQIVLAAKEIKLVDTPDQAEEATKFGRLLQASTKSTEEFFKPVKQKIDELKKPVLEAEKAELKTISDEKDRLGKALTSYSAQKEKERREAERKAQEEAEQRAREEQLARAIELESIGETEQAEFVLEEPVETGPIVVQAAPVRFTGSIGRTYYKCQVTSPMELVKAIAAGQVSIEAITVNQSWLNKKADLDKEGFHVPGCKLDKQTSTSFRG